MQKKRIRNEGFTLLEVLLVVGLVAILAGIVILAINPTKQIEDTNNSERRVDVNTILNGIYQFAIDNDGSIPSGIPVDPDCSGVATHEICITGGTCTSLVDLSDLTLNEEYLVSIPTDPTGAAGDGAGYQTAQSANGRVTICAPDAQQGETISVTR